MIQKIKIVNLSGETLILNMRNPYTNGLAVTSVDGLGPVKGTISTSSRANFDGCIVNSVRLENRNIVFHIRFLNGFNPEKLRQTTYKFFPVKRSITMIFETDARECAIEGIVESNEPNIFSNAEDTSISIVCSDPHFRAIEESKVFFSGIKPSFEFPFSNESLNSNEIEISRLDLDNTKNVVYQGDSDSGMRIRMHFLENTTNVRIFNMRTSDVFELDTSKLKELTGHELLPKDDVIISTFPGKKSVILFRDGVFTNILNCVTNKSKWFQLSKGDNVIAFTAATGQNGIEFTVEFTELYEGL